MATIKKEEFNFKHCNICNKDIVGKGYRFEI